METQPRFDLNVAIANWQQQLAQQSGLTPVVRRELEAHLRDTVTELQARGLNNEEAFWLARRRVGRPGQLAEEFAKSDPAEVWRDRALCIVWALLAIDLWYSIAGNLLSNLLNRGMMIVTNAFELSMLRAGFWLAEWLPVAVAAFFLAKRGLKLTRASHLRFRASRFGIAAVVLLLMLTENLGIILSRWEVLTHPSSDGIAWNDLCSMFAFSILWPSILLALMLWLMPREDHQTPISKMV